MDPEGDLDSISFSSPPQPPPPPTKPKEYSLSPTRKNNIYLNPNPNGTEKQNALPTAQKSLGKSTVISERKLKELPLTKLYGEGSNLGFGLTERLESNKKAETSMILERSSVTLSPFTIKEIPTNEEVLKLEPDNKKVVVEEKTKKNEENIKDKIEGISWKTVANVGEKSENNRENLTKILQKDQHDKVSSENTKSKGIQWNPEADSARIEEDSSEAQNIIEKNQVYNGDKQNEIVEKPNSSVTDPKISTKLHKAIVNTDLNKKPDIDELKRNILLQIRYMNLSNLTSPNKKRIITDLLPKIKSISDQAFYQQLSSKLLCTNCNKIKIKITLTCSHHCCRSCIKLRMRNYIHNPSTNTFKKFSCPKCHINFSNSDINEILYDKPEIKQLSEISHEQKCQKCKIKYPLRLGFFSENKCLHLCSNCYSDSLFTNSSCCSYCRSPYKNKQATLNRTIICDICKQKGDFSQGSHVKDCYRKVCIPHTLCYECLNEFTDIRHCKLCKQSGQASNERLNKRFLKSLRHIINKTCCICKNVFALPDLDLSKSCCEYIVCSQCQSSPHCACCKL